MTKEVLNSNNASIKRFLNPVQELRLIITNAKSQENIPLAFYQSAARQYLFYLEALCRIYKNTNNNKLFKKLKFNIKSLEDQLGKVDQYESFHNKFSKLKDFPAVLLNQLFQHFQNELNNLSNLLIKDNWLNDKKNRVDKIITQLDKVDWLNPEEEKKAIAKTIRKEIKTVLKDYKSEKLNFDKIEEGVHEFRRNLRWISINAQALNGLIQLKKDEKAADFKKYLTHEVINSLFNKMPKNRADLEVIEFSESAFYALSWLIAESGDLKDEGLELICIEKLMKETDFITDDKIATEAKKFAQNVQLSLKEIKAKMKTLVDAFIYDDKILEILKKDLKAV
ncbi:MAG: hypothetical protein H7098_06940 [Oligoflexus sp.]|nr:hypothetical protein [Pseudopedobacter sp.]